MLHLVSQIDEAVSVIRRKWTAQAQVGIVLGSGLGGLADDIEVEATFGYDELPHFARSTVIGHTGRLVCGRLAGVSVVAMQGRLHAYEGYTQKQITFPVRVMKALGADTLFVSNACGGLNPQYQQGDVMVIDDHINMMWDNPLIGVNDERLGSRWPDMCQPYCPKLITSALAVARRENFVLHRGIYVAVKGPNYEPRSEYRMLRQIGADVVGMSTVPEVIVAVHGGMRVMGLSVVTNVCSPDNLQETDGKDVVAAAAQAGAKLRTIVHGVLKDTAW